MQEMSYSIYCWQREPYCPPSLTTAHADYHHTIHQPILHQFIFALNNHSTFPPNLLSQLIIRTTSSKKPFKSPPVHLLPKTTQPASIPPVQPKIPTNHTSIFNKCDQLKAELEIYLDWPNVGIVVESNERSVIVEDWSEAISCQLSVIGDWVTDQFWEANHPPNPIWVERRRVCFSSILGFACEEIEKVAINIARIANAVQCHSYFSYLLKKAKLTHLKVVPRKVWLTFERCCFWNVMRQSRFGHRTDLLNTATHLCF